MEPPSRKHVIICPYAFYVQDSLSAQHRLLMVQANPLVSAVCWAADAAEENLGNVPLLLERLFGVSPNTESSLILVRFAQSEIYLCKLFRWFSRFCSEESMLSYIRQPLLFFKVFYENQINLWSYFIVGFFCFFLVVVF